MRISKTLNYLIILFYQLIITLLFEMADQEVQQHDLDDGKLDLDALQDKA